MHQEVQVHNNESKHSCNTMAVDALSMIESQRTNSTKKVQQRCKKHDEPSPFRSETKEDLTLNGHLTQIVLLQSITYVLLLGLQLLQNAPYYQYRFRSYTHVCTL